MTRAEVKAEIDIGWLSWQVAAIFLGFGSDHTRMDALIGKGIRIEWKRSALASKNGISTRRVALDGVLRLTGKTAAMLLDEHFPRRKNDSAIRQQTVAVLDSCEKRDAFRSKHNRVSDVVARWMARPEEDMSFGELRLIFALLNLARRVNRFELMVTSKQLERAAQLDRESLPKARRSLERRKILRTERNGPKGWIYTLHDPVTGLPLESSEEDERDSVTFLPEEEWAETSHS